MWPILRRDTPLTSSITPPNPQSFKRYRAEGNLTAVFVFLQSAPYIVYDRKINQIKKKYEIT
jgi:hypothetical protein